MKTLLTFFIFILTLTQSFGQRSIGQSEDQRFQAQVARDTLALKHLLHDEVVYIHSNALTESKADFLNSIKSGNITYLAMQVEGPRSIRSYGKTGISNGIVHVNGLLKGTQFDMRLRYTAVYLKQKGRWQLVSWQSTRIP